MVKLVFAHDNKFKLDEKGNLYSGGAFNNEVFERYTKLCDELIVIGRVERIDSNQVRNLNLITSNKIKFVGMPNVNSIRGLFNIKFVQKEIENIVKECDGVIARTSTLGLMAAKAAKKFKKACLVEVVGCIWDALWNYSLKGKIIAPFMFFLYRRWILKSKFVIYVSNEFLQRRYPTKGYKLSCSDVVIPSLSEDIIEKRLRRIESMKDRPINLGIIGNLDIKYKGHETAFRALALLKNKGFDFRLLCLGGGSKQKLEYFAERLGIKEKVTFCGVVPSGEPVFDWLDNIDIFLIPSLQEGLPRALIEAMSRGCPAIGTRVGGIPELIDNNFVIKPKDFRGLAFKILELVNDKDLMKEQAIRNFEKSKDYVKELLDERREKFLNEFVTYSI
ncbi:glycosyltransferase family 4 protein [Caldicellulosiruptor morganii]|uniref:Glycosyltransferase family 4 protein n=1 Tax=Caldicellulosiruptor morganii TaxID=1387555 RepID=A0ABY7BMA0_9FIRM|nr:glycosyltransferase family 4 protein [Caldicellulosiruptor morganii]WAM33635.1 glycosyltransferase family 4 protein [Caldicellulosiruptor morganii]